MKKDIKEYIKRSVRKLRHRKGYGVHSPFAYSIITEVIEEKLPYYDYRRMQRTYHKQAPIPHKVACLIYRLANRFRCRRAIELHCDGGYSALPLMLVDSRLSLISIAAPDIQAQLRDELSWLPSRLQQVTFHQQVADVSADDRFDMIIVSGNPFEPAGKPTPEQQQAAAGQLVAWILAHAQADTVIFVKGIQIGHRLEAAWDALCDSDDVSITMDLYDYGLSILRPHFFKQHYVVSF